MEYFDPKIIKSIFVPQSGSNGEDNGQVTVVGGSSLFKGAPLLSLKTASRIVDMVFFSSPEPALEKISSYMHSELSSFVWVPFSEVSAYIEKSEAVLIGPGFMRFKSENSPHNARLHVCDEACQFTRDVTKSLLAKFPNKKWVIDAGSLQTIDASWLPKGCIVTPNKKEFRLLFGHDGESPEVILKAARKHNCTVVVKGPETIVASGEKCVIVKGGNAGLTKGGTGDVQAGLTVALFSKNDAFLAASTASWVIKKSAEDIYKRVGTFYSADDVAEEVPRTLAGLVK